MAHLPVHVLHLEGEVGRKYGSHNHGVIPVVIQLLNLQLQRAQVHRQRVAGLLLPSISVRVSGQEGVQIIRETEVQVVVAALHGEPIDVAQDLSRRSTSLEELPRVLAIHAVCTNTHRHQSTGSRAVGHVQVDHRFRSHSRELDRSDRVLSHRRQRSRSSRDPASRLVDRQSLGKSGVDFKIAKPDSLGNDLRHLNVHLRIALVGMDCFLPPVHTTDCQFSSRSSQMELLLQCGFS